MKLLKLDYDNGVVASAAFFSRWMHNKRSSAFVVPEILNEVRALRTLYAIACLRARG